MVIQHVLDWGRSTTIIKCVTIVGEDYDEEAARPDYPPPFCQGAYGICRVFKVVRGKHEIIGTIANPVEICGFADEIEATGLPRIKLENLPLRPATFPNCLRGENAVVYSKGISVDWKDSAIQESATWAADFKPYLIFYCQVEPEGDSQAPAQTNACSSDQRVGTNLARGRAIISDIKELNPACFSLASIFA